MFNILVVEDQKNMRESLVIAFKRAGYHVQSVENGGNGRETPKRSMSSIW